MPEYERLEVDRTHDGVVLVTLSRSDRLQVLTFGMFAALKASPLRRRRPRRHRPGGGARRSRAGVLRRPRPRSLPVFGRQDQHGHAEIVFRDVRIPVTNLLGTEGDGFTIAQAWLGPGRIHHCMRAIGAAERALSMMVARAKERVAFGSPLAEQGTVQAAIAESRLEIEPVRLLTLETAWLINRHGGKGARTEIAGIKVAAPRVATAVTDRAIQVHGGLGVSNDVPLARKWGWHRAMRIFDGPDEVHLRTMAKAELRRG